MTIDHVQTLPAGKDALGDDDPEAPRERGIPRRSGMHIQRLTPFTATRARARGLPPAHPVHHPPLHPSPSFPPIHPSSSTSFGSGPPFLSTPYDPSTDTLARYTDSDDADDPGVDTPAIRPAY